MCFSATVSFGASAILAIAGIASLKKVQTPSQLMFALFPFIFSIQQFTEGFVWLTLTNADYRPWQYIPIYTFVFFAQVLWTIWVPLSFYLIEKNIKRKKILAIFVGIGSFISLFHLYNLIFFDVTASVKPYHIYYDLDFPLRHNLIMEIFYLLIIICPALISSIHRMHILGILLFSSFIITKFYFNDYVISVWCFFSALISIIVYLIMRDLKENEQLRKVVPDFVKLKST
ncbi:MAG: DUF6629 family protein [Bacteroidia bacterium]